MFFPVFFFIRHLSISENCPNDKQQTKKIQSFQLALHSLKRFGDGMESFKSKQFDEHRRGEEEGQSSSWEGEELKVQKTEDGCAADENTPHTTAGRVCVCVCFNVKEKNRH